MPYVLFFVLVVIVKNMFHVCYQYLSYKNDSISNENENPGFDIRPSSARLYLNWLVLTYEGL